jgi:hypothetical protein
MPPKKKDDGPKEKPILGRFKSNLKVLYKSLCKVNLSRMCAVHMTCAFGTAVTGAIAVDAVGASAWAQLTLLTGY